MASSQEEIMPEDHGDFLDSKVDLERKGGWRRPETSEVRHFYDNASSEVDEVDNGMDRPPEFFGIPRCRGVVEWINCFLFDSLLLLLEAAINLWLATSLNSAGFGAEYKAIIVMLLLPSVINPLIWLRLKSYYKISSAFIFALLFIGFPSPLFLYGWHLYLSMFSSMRETETSKLLSNSFRMVHAVVASMPLMIINLATLINQLRVDGLEDYAIDIKELSEHMTEVNMHGLAFVLSMINFVRGACLYNERQTMTLLFSVVALPFTVLTSLTRIILLAIVIAFVEPEWTTILLVGLVVANVVLFWACRKGTKLIKGQGVGLREGPIIQPITQNRDSPSTLNSDDLNPVIVSVGCSNPGSQQCLSSSCCNPARQIVHRGGLPTPKTGRYVISPGSHQSKSCWQDMGKTLLLSVASIIVPSGYTNDVKSHHPRIKGGLYIMLNFIVNMSILGVTLGYTILHRVPNTIHGVSLPNPSIKVEVPSSKIIVETGGMDVAVNLPNTKIDLGSMPSIDATLNTDSSDEMHAVLLPVILAAICVPFVIMRAAMMELDCFVTRRKQLGDNFDDLVVMGKKARTNNRRQTRSLAESLASNTESKELKARLYVSLICSILAMLVMTAFLMLMGVLIYLNL